MAHLTRDDILKLAHLSQITITDQEAEQLAQDITSVLSYADYLAIRAASLPETMVSEQRENRLRADVPRPGDKEGILACAPQTDGDYFIVPRVLKGS